MKILQTARIIKSCIPLERFRYGMAARIFVAFAALFLYASCAVAAQTAAGSVTFVLGKVLVMKESKRGVFITASVGDKLMQGDMLKTEKASKAEITLDDGSVIYVADNSQMLLKQFILNRDAAERKVVVATTEGKLRFAVSKVVKAASKADSKWKSSNFTIETPTAVAGIQGTDFVVTVSRGHTNIAVFEGYVKIGNVSYLIRGSITLSADQASIVKKDEKPKDAAPLTEAQKELLQLETKPTKVEAAEVKAALAAVINELAKAQTGKAPEELIAAALAAGLDVNQSLTATIEQGVDIVDTIAAAEKAGVDTADTIDALLEQGMSLEFIVQAAIDAGISKEEIIEAAKELGIPLEVIENAVDAVGIEVGPMAPSSPAAP